MGMGEDKGDAGKAQHRGAGMGMNGPAALAAGRQAGIAGREGEKEQEQHG